MILAALVFIRKVTETTTVSRVTEEDVARDQVHVLQGKLIPDYVAVFRIHGPFLFGSTRSSTISAHSSPPSRPSSSSACATSPPSTPPAFRRWNGLPMRSAPPAAASSSAARASSPPR